jgi:endonuclease-8
LGQDVLDAAFDASQSVSALHAAGGLEVGIALLTQSILAGIGNVFKSEVCFACAVNPFRLVNTLSMEETNCLVATARKYMLANVTDTAGDQIVTYAGKRRTTGRDNREDRLWVYGRKREPCRKCGTPIESRKQSDARITFWCPRCQPLATHQWRDALAR